MKMRAMTAAAGAMIAKKNRTMTHATNASFSEIAEAMLGADHIAVISHARPDGDAIGSAVALASALEAAGKRVTVLNEDGVPPNLAFLPGAARVHVPAPGEAIGADLAVALDTGAESRLGDRCRAACAGARRWINIDHHISNSRYGDLAHVDPDSPATGQIVYELIAAAGWALTPEARDNLYVAISTDTGSFRYPATTARTYEVAAALVAAGCDIGDLNQKTYETFPFRRVLLLQELLGTLRMTKGNRVASWSLTAEMIARVGMQPGDSEGLIDIIRSVDSVVASVFFEELPDDRIRVSMRSKDRSIVDACAICALFGGGGHPLAAGARLRGTLAEAQDRVLTAIHDAIDHAGN